jgi:fosfomycin resistance protein FosX
MQVEAISHITFIVRDLERMATFFCKGLGAREVYDSQHKELLIFS